MFTKNVAVTGFTVGMVARADGTDITTGTVNGFRTLDGGTQTALGGTPVHEGNGQWSVNLTAAEMNGDIVGLVFTHTSAITVQVTIKTTTINPDASGNVGADVQEWRGTVPLVLTAAGRVDADAVAISGDTTAADNVEAAFESAGGNTAVMRLAQLSVINSAGSAIVATGGGAAGHGINATGAGTGAGMQVLGGATGQGLACYGGGATPASSQEGFLAQGGSSGATGVKMAATTTGVGCRIEAGGTNATGGLVVAGGNGSAALLQAAGNGSGMEIRGSGTQPGLAIDGGGGAGAAAHGVAIRAGSASTADGINVIGPSVSFGTGGSHGIQSAGKAAGHGAVLLGGPTNGAGLVAVGNAAAAVIPSGSAHGLYAIADGGAAGLRAEGGPTNGLGIAGLGKGTSPGMRVTNTTGAGMGFSAIGGPTSTAGAEIKAGDTSNGHGVTIEADGTGVALRLTHETGRHFTTATVDEIVDAIFAEVQPGGATFSAEIQRIRKILWNRWKIDVPTKRQTFYDDDGVATLRAFDLKDSAGVATATEPFERVPV